MGKLGALIKMIFTCGLFLVLVGFVLIRQDELTTIFNSYLLKNSGTVTLDQVNEYYRDYDFMFVQNTRDFSPRSYQDIINIYYTVINSGQTDFTFYCPSDYVDCLEHVKIIADDQTLLSDINNYVHPYNGFAHIETVYDTLGKVNISLIKSYTDEDIAAINSKVDELYPMLVSEYNSIEDNIRRVHDYIINTTKYDSDRSERGIINYRSDIAYGPLFQGYAICGGYSDLMELFLEKMGIRNYKVSSEMHVWNVVEINGRWYHIDLTWDDPVASDGRNYLDHSYFLINTQQLLSIEGTQHNFMVDHYLELKGA